MGSVSMALARVCLAGAEKTVLQLVAWPTVLVAEFAQMGHAPAISVGEGQIAPQLAVQTIALGTDLARTIMRFQHAFATTCSLVQIACSLSARQPSQ